MEAFRRGVKETIASHHVNMGKGLDAEQVSKNREEYGANVFVAEKSFIIEKNLNQPK